MDVLDHAFEPLLVGLKLVLLILWGAVRAILPESLLPHKPIKNEIVLVTGASSGLGRLIALAFARRGAKLVLLDINECGLRNTRLEVQRLGVKCYMYKCDVGKQSEVYKTAAEIKSEVGNVHVLINNAGIVVGGNLLHVSDDSIEAVMRVNALAHIWMYKAFLPQMIEKKRGHLVTVASAAGLIGAADLVDYCASKFAAVGIIESLRLELDESGHEDIYTTLICPFFIDTEGKETPFSSRLLPILDANYVAERVVGAVLTNTPIMLMPRMLYVLHACKAILPVRALLHLNTYFDPSSSMRAFLKRSRRR